MLLRYNKMRFVENLRACACAYKYIYLFNKCSNLISLLI